MANCPYCGAMLEPGTKFCGTCGRPLPTGAPPMAAAPSMTGGRAPTPPPAMAAAPSFGSPPPASPPVQSASPAQPNAQPNTPRPATGRVCTKRAASNGTTFEVYEFEMHRMARIVLQGSSVSVEAGLLHYWHGQIQMHAAAPSLGGMAKSFLTKEKAVRPVYQGAGEIFLEPTFGEIEFLDLDGRQTWILDKGAFLACDQGVQLGMYTNPAFQSFFGGEGMFQTQVSGVGKVMFESPGPLERIDLRGQTLTVDGSFAVARTASVDFRVEKATKGLFRSMMSGEGLVNVFSGQGTVLLAPIPNRYLTLMGQFGSLYSAIRSISRG
jgi:uncharacterized protein (AIM24 family)